MFLCPICQEKKFETESAMAKHLLSCWKEQNPYHVSKSAPHSETITTRQVNESVKDFFAAYDRRN